MISFGRGKLKIFDGLVILILFFLAYKLHGLWLVSAWLDRTEFFNDGVYAPNLVDMIINEVVFPLVLIIVVIGRFRWLYVFYVLLGATVYFTRAGIILFVLACIISPAFTNFTKFKIILFGFFASLSILVIRFSGEVPKLEDLILFYLEYPFAGIGRLLVTDVDHGVNQLLALSLFFRPVGVFTFSYDYLLGLNGYFSIERYSGKMLSEFAYIPLLENNFNAFGTIVYPYALTYGLYFGVLVFIISMTIYYCSLRLIFYKSVVFRVSLFLCISGFLFSWNAPFIWLAPFIVRLMFGAAAVRG
jgi:hypothetical protein